MERKDLTFTDAIKICFSKFADARADRNTGILQFLIWSFRHALMFWVDWYSDQTATWPQFFRVFSPSLFSFPLSP